MCNCEVYPLNLLRDYGFDLVFLRYNMNYAHAVPIFIVLACSETAPDKDIDAHTQLLYVF